MYELEVHPGSIDGSASSQFDYPVSSGQPGRCTALERERTNIGCTVGAQQDRRTRNGHRAVEIEPFERELGNRGVVGRDPFDGDGALSFSETRDFWHGTQQVRRHKVVVNAAHIEALRIVHRVDEGAPRVCTCPPTPSPGAPSHVRSVLLRSVLLLSMARVLPPRFPGVPRALEMRMW